MRKRPTGPRQPPAEQDAGKQRDRAEHDAGHPSPVTCDQRQTEPKTAMDRHIRAGCRSLERSAVICFQSVVPHIGQRGNGGAVAI
jgi:hypothetical protein